MLEKMDDPSKAMNVVDHDSGFQFADGTVATSLEEFYFKIKKIDNISMYVTNHKNDFSAWVEHALHKPALATLMRPITSKEELLKVLKTYLMDETTEQHTQAPQEIKKEAPKMEMPKAKEEQFYPKEALHDEVVVEEATKKRTATHLPPAKVEIPVHENEDQTLTEAESKEYAELIERAKKEIHKVMKGQHDTVHQVFISLICDAHTLLEGVPGLAKSLLVESFSKVIKGTSFHRIQFMPDILPADVIGSQIYNPQTNEFVTVKGPIFANFILADEINRAPPKTHSALMEAMQEKKINIDKEEYILDRPFLVLATQNPLENKGTYALPEAVLDRFLFKITLDYPLREHEKEIIIKNATTVRGLQGTIQPVLTKEIVLKIQKMVKKVYVSSRIKEYILDIIDATRGKNKNIVGMKFISYGGGPRASIYLGIAARAQALLSGRHYVLPEDVKYVARSILRHRLALNFKGKAHNISTDKVVEEILMKIPGL